jgi:hypothetical protein
LSEIKPDVAIKEDSSEMKEIGGIPPEDEVQIDKVLYENKENCQVLNLDLDIFCGSASPKSLEDSKSENEKSEVAKVDDEKTKDTLSNETTDGDLNPEKEVRNTCDNLLCKDEDEVLKTGRKRTLEKEVGSLLPKKSIKKITKLREIVKPKPPTKVDLGDWTCQEDKILKKSMTEFDPKEPDYWDRGFSIY